MEKYRVDFYADATSTCLIRSVYQEFHSFAEAISWARTNVPPAGSMSGIVVNKVK